MTTTTRKQITKKPPSADEVTDTGSLEAEVFRLDDQDTDFEEWEDGWVRYYRISKELIPGVPIDLGILALALTEDFSHYLAFREPTTGEYIDVIGEPTTRAKPLTSIKALELIASLTCGEIIATPSLLKKLPVKFQSRIVRSLSRIMGTEKPD